MLALRVTPSHISYIFSVILVSPLAEDSLHLSDKLNARPEAAGIIGQGVVSEMCAFKRG